MVQKLRIVQALRRRQLSKNISSSQSSSYRTGTLAVASLGQRLLGLSYTRDCQPVSWRSFVVGPAERSSANIARSAVSALPQPGLFKNCHPERSRGISIPFSAACFTILTTIDKKEDIWEFEKLEQQLDSLLTEISELSKKKPNDPLNKFKLKFINSTLAALNQLLTDHRPYKDFEAFDVDDLPSNSAVVVILSKYAAAVHRFRIDNTTKDAHGWYWVAEEKKSSPVSFRPENFKYEPT